MANIVDGEKNWPCTLDSVTQQQIAVTMAGDNGMRAVCGGKPRQGNVQDQGLSYDVQLPGDRTAGTLKVTLKR